MSFKSESKEITLSEVVFSKKNSDCVQGDIIVPDTKGDISKILQTDAVAVINSREISGGRATVSGTVYTTVLYIPQDGTLDTMSNSMNFSHSVKTEYDDSINLWADCRIKSVEHSLYNSRKMNIKVSLSINIEGCKSSKINVLSECSSKYGKTEISGCEIESVPENIFANDVIPFRESFDLPSGYPGAESVLMCSAKFTDRDYKLLSNKAVIRGNINVSVLYRGEDGSIVSSDFIQPFTEITDAPGAQEDMKEDIRTKLSAFTATPTANGDGNMRSFFVEGNIFVNTHCYRSKTEKIITDMFCTDVPVSLGCIKIPASCKSGISLISQVRDIVRSGNISEIIRVATFPDIASCEKSGNNVLVSGNINAELLCRNQGGEFFTLKTTLPYSCSEKFDGNSPIAECEVLNCSADITGGDAEVKVSVSTKIECSDSAKVLCVTDVSVQEGESNLEKPSITIYCTREGDTLWNIAKHYSAAIDSIKTANNITDAIIPGQRIVIPR